MKIFITGICGFIGANLADYYLKKKFKVSGCDNLIGGYLTNINQKKVSFYKADCEKLEEMKKIIKNIDILIHTAAYPHEGLSSFSPYEICKSNFLGSGFGRSSIYVMLLRVMLFTCKKEKGPDLSGPNFFEGG